MEIKVPIIVENFDRHFEIKDEILNLLDKEKSHYFRNEFDSISKTDWYIENNFKKEYWNFIFHNLKKNIENVCLNILHFPIDTFEHPEFIKNYWFQQYKNGDIHNWHRHFGCSFNVVYFVELPEKNLSTEFKSPISEKIHTIEAKEGDILFFPSFLIHRSPLNKTNKRKTVVAFNLA